MQSVAFNTLARAKLVFYKQKSCYKLVIAFNVTEVDAKGRYKFPVQSKCDFVSGDMNKAILAREFERNMKLAMQVLRTNNIELVETMRPCWG